jgi:hypothetical protein
LISSGIICFIKLAAFVKGKALGENQSLKLQWMKSEQVLFAVHANQTGIPLDN